MFYVYKIYYDEKVVYIGRTNNIDNRVRQHITQSKIVDGTRVTKIEIARLETEADMNLYELYYILALKPRLNSKDTTTDELNVELPELIFNQYTSYKYNEWKKVAYEKQQQKIDRNFRTNEIKELIKTEVSEAGKEILLTQYQLLTQEAL